MVGTIIVTAGYSIIPNVDKSISDGSDFFDIEYDFNRALDIVKINEDQKSITFEIVGNGEEITIKLNPCVII